ncbi:hypothetical protein [Vibrio ezurae]|uniref:Outer membrane protein beta-barrel domain-containing protein n=1 Tax=Vibrio ezurae NBRC 102218 TaxID=1219080 RepID=U3CJE1_9VIBR|nr:hypothetical protein [Vibrio ezurae]GAD81269.1 hypothetical protein VEZ01S_54_00200 [Vibrio ezurae NBRC 102218]
MKLRALALICATSFTATAFANSTSIYLEQNVASNAADHGEYATEAGANIAVSENGSVYIGFDDQGWLAAGYGHDFSLSDKVNFNVYTELGKWETGEEILIEGIVNYDINDNISVFTGIGYNRSEQVLEKFSDSGINTNKFIAGTQLNWAGFNLAYQYTHENRNGSNGGYTHAGNEAYFSQDDYRTNEHEVILSKTINDFTPYIKYTYFNTHEGEISSTGDYGSLRGPIDNDNILTLGISYQF